MGICGYVHRACEQQRLGKIAFFNYMETNKKVVCFQKMIYNI